MLVDSGTPTCFIVGSDEYSKIPGMSYFEVSNSSKVPIESITALRVTTRWSKVEIISEEFVVYTTFGFVPTVLIKVDDKEIPRMLHIGAKSLASQLNEMRQDNKYRFTGLKFEISKVSDDKRAPYQFQ